MPFYFLLVESDFLSVSACMNACIPFRSSSFFDFPVCLLEVLIVALPPLHLLYNLHKKPMDVTGHILECISGLEDMEVWKVLLMWQGHVMMEVTIHF